MTPPGAQTSQMRGALDTQIEADKQFNASIRATLDLALPPLPPPPIASPPLAPPTIPPIYEDRYKKGWSDAWESIRGEADPLAKWLPVICFCCVLIGFVLGWLSGGMFLIASSGQ